MARSGAGKAKDRKEFNSWLGLKFSEISEVARGRLLAYGDLVIERTESLGLIARGDVPRFFMRHLREAAAPSLIGYPAVGHKVIDIGSGGGLPGIPLSILREDLEVSLVEPRNRKAAFLERTVLQLGLGAAHVYMASIDALVRSHPDLRFDLAVSRAVGWTPAMVSCLEVLVESGPLIRYGDPGFRHEGVKVIEIESETPRALQIWHRTTWSGLPGAR